MLKVNQFNEIAKDTLDEWMYFLKKTEIKPGFKAKGLLKAKEKLDVMKLSEKDQKEYKYYLESLRDDASYAMTVKMDIEEAVREAKKEEKIEVAKNAILKGADNQFISEITGLLLEEIEKLRIDLL